MKWNGNYMKTLLEKDDGGKMTQYLAVLTAQITLFTAGIYLGWTAPSLTKLMSPEYPINITENEASYIAVIGPVGHVIGGIIASTLQDIIGRKRTILSISLPQVLSFVLIYFSYSSKLLMYVQRILGGMGEGATLTILPSYIAEVAEPEVRGVLGTFTTLTYISGALFINVLGSYMDIHNTALICLVCPVIFLATFSQMPDSPYHLLMKKQEDKARDSLKILRRKQNIEKELTQMTLDVNRQMSESGTFKDLFMIPSNRRAFFLVCTARIVQQYTGCTTFAIYYQILIAQATNLSPVLGSSLLMVTQIGVTLLSSLFIDKFGRRPLFIISTSGCFLALLSQAIFFTLRDSTGVDMSNLAWLPLLLMVFFIIFFASGLGVALNIFISEIYSTSIKSKALSINSGVFAFCIISSTKFYQISSDKFGLAVPFYVFSFCTFCGVLFFYFVLPETKGKTLETIQQELKGNIKKMEKKNEENV